MKKRRTKLRKFLLRSLLFILLLTGSGAVLLRSRAVQTWLAQKATAFLSKELSTKVSIAALEFDFSGNIRAEHVYLGDQKGDSMIYVRVLVASLSDFSNEKRLVAFSRAEVAGAFVNIGHHKDSEGTNIDFLVDYLNPPRKKRTGPPKYWSIYFDHAVVADSRFHYFDDTEPEPLPGELDEFHLQFSNLSGTLEKFWLIDDSIHFYTPDLSAVERSGLEIEKLDATCNIHYKGMDFTGLIVQTPCSTLDGELHFKYPGYKYLDEFVHNTEWSGHLNRSAICLRELSIFNGALANHPEEMVIEAGISGTFDKLRLSNVDAQVGSFTRFRGNYYLEGLPQWRTTYVEFDIPYACTSAYDLSRLLNGMELLPTLDKLGKMEFNGKFTGQFLDFKTDGILDTDIGDLQASLNMNFKPGYDKAEFSGHIFTDGFDVGRFYSVEPDLGITAFDITLSGSGISSKTFNLTVEADIPSYTLRGRTFTQGHVNGDLTSRNFTGSASFLDPRINASFDGLVDFSGATPYFDFTAGTGGLDLYELGLDSVRTLIWGQTTVRMTGLDPATMEGTIDARDVAVHRLGQIYQFDTQHIEKWNKGKRTRLEFSGDMVNGYVRGVVNPGKIHLLAQNAISRVFPERVPPAVYQGTDSFTYSIAIPQTGLIASYIDADLSTSSIAISGFMDGGSSTLEVTSVPMDICYQRTALTQLDLHALKRDSTSMEFVVSAGALLLNNEKRFVNLELDGKARNSHAEFGLRLKDKSGENDVNLAAEGDILHDSIPVTLGKSNLHILSDDWDLENDSRVTVFNNNRFNLRNVYLNGDDHYIEINGYISASQRDTTHLEFGNFTIDNLRPFFANEALDSLNGVLNGDLRITGLLGTPRFWGDISAKKLRFEGYDYGDLAVSLKNEGISGQLGLDGRFTHGTLQGLALAGTFAYEPKPGQEALDFEFELPQTTKLAAIQPFLQDIVTIKNGTLGGRMHLGGNTDKPLLTGSARVRDARLKVDYLQTEYSFDAEFKSNANGFFNSRPIWLYDESGTNFAIGNVSITHKNFSNYYLDLLIDSARNLKVINTTPKDNDLFYGTAFADGSCRIYGPFDKISMDINLRSRKNSQFNLLYSDLEENKRSSIVKFRDHYGKVTSKEEKKEKSSIYRININITATPDAEAQFVIDRQRGDIIRGRGSGELRMLYDENENFFLYGTYTVQEGEYRFSIPGIDVVTKRIGLEQGGTVSWSGDPYNAILNMNGSFEKKISPAALMSSLASGSSKNYPATRVLSKLMLKGNLFSPDISFDIQMPDLASSGGSTANEVNSVIQRIRTDKDETMKQAVALLLFGNFITPSFAQNPTSGGAGVSGYGVAGNSLSAIASNVVNNLFSRLGIPTRIQVNIDDVRGISGSNAKVFVNSEWFLSDRLRLDLNYDPTVAMLVSNVALPLNFNLEYMTRNENWHIKAFSRSNNLLLQQNSSTVTNGVSGNTLGAGVIWRKEFDTFRPVKKKPATTQGPK
ncbi:MAG: translocation/assembly module TamB domain-containing protein [Bacteroidetes bacterium]|nr:translocation/assembly module TamB domain-containing protein [Bacteroidota bacterium]